MSQQEFVPEPQSNGQGSMSNDEVENPVQPYYWSTSPVENNKPKEEPVSSYDELELEQGYRAQDGFATPYHQEKTTYNQGPQYQQQQVPPQYSPDGDAFESGYRGYQNQQSYNQQTYNQQNVPYSAPSQQNRFNPAGLIILIVIGAIVLSSLFSFGDGRGFMHGGGFFLLFPLFFILRGVFFRRGGGRYRRGPWRW